MEGMLSNIGFKELVFVAIAVIIIFVELYEYTLKDFVIGFIIAAILCLMYLLVEFLFLMAGLG